MSTKEKQQFLRAEILEQSYDIEAFQSFLEKAKPNDALDIEAWSFD